MSADRRFIAEWEDVDAVLVALPHCESDWNYILDEARDQFKRLIETLTQAGEYCIILTDKYDNAANLVEDIDTSLYKIVEAPYNDTWTRDYGPITIETRTKDRIALDFGFNGWGLKFASDRDNLVNLNLSKLNIFDNCRLHNVRSFILEGGSIDTDGKGTILTTTRCLCSDNRNGGLDKEEVEKVLSKLLGTERVLWLDHGDLAGDDTDSHIDTLCRMAPGDTIVYTGSHDMDDEHFESLLKMRIQLEKFETTDGNPYRLIELPLPDAIYDEEGQRLPATYANYLVTERNIFIPTYGQPNNDRRACEMLKVAFPHHKQWCVDCNTLIKQHGSLHCSTMQIPRGVLSERV